MIHSRTDLALESREMYRRNIEEKSEVPGIEVEEDNRDGAIITRVHIVSEEGERALGKPKGSYITIEIPGLHNGDPQQYLSACELLGGEITRLTEIPKDGSVLVVGLGNRNITADALGPKTVEKLMITRHLLEHIPDQIDESIKPVCALAPGVLGITGIETGEIVRGVVDRVGPKLVIAVDALAARRIDRINTTIQIADTGINPGSGVGNSRQALSRETLGIPVIAIGVPTVVDAVTMANDTVDMVIDAVREQAGEETAIFKMLSQMDEKDKYQLISSVLTPYLGELTVTTKQVDSVMEKMSKVLANGLNMAFHEGITPEEIESYLG